MGLCLKLFWCHGSVIAFLLELLLHSHFKSTWNVVLEDSLSLAFGSYLDFLHTTSSKVLQVLSSQNWPLDFSMEIRKYGGDIYQPEQSKQWEMVGDQYIDGID